MSWPQKALLHPSFQGRLLTQIRYIITCQYLIRVGIDFESELHCVNIVDMPLGANKFRLQDFQTIEIQSKGRLSVG